MSTLERISKASLLGLVAWLPFEFRSFPLISNLQWLFIVVALCSVPLLARDWRRLLRDRVVLLAIAFVFTQWLAAAFAGEHAANSVKAAMRVSAGLLLFCAVSCQSDRKSILKVWCISSIAAAAYGLADFAGFGAPGLFREAEFYIGHQLRLSGSFEYATTAAAFYAMSLPLVLMAPTPAWIRVAGGLLLWTALILTYSRGAVIAMAAVLLCAIVMSGRTKALKLAAAAFALYAVLAMFQPLLVTRSGNVKSGPPIAAEYNVSSNTIHQQPAVADRLQVIVKNSGSETWPASGPDSVILSYHWYDTARMRILEMSPTETLLPGDVEPNEIVTLTAAFRTPDAPGLYLLDWDLKRKNGGWFSTENGVMVGVVEAHVDEGASPRKGNGDLSRWYQGASGPREPSLDAGVSRTLLWKAAAGLALKSPVTGAGPDNFRLLYGRELGFGRWDSNIRSNNLYLELLAGSGLIGLGAFIAMLASLHWTFRPASIGIAVFLMHGLVDVFLMTTPIYFAFWILMGLAHEKRT